MGHMELQTPVYNPLMFITMMKVAKYKCLCCHRVCAGCEYVLLSMIGTKKRDAFNKPSFVFTAPPYSTCFCKIVQDESQRRSKVLC